jgi:serine/threonine-protein kinase RsbW
MFRCERISVPVMRRVLGDTLRGLGVDEESVYDILLAATEACTNVLTHGGPQADGYAVVTSLGTVGCQVEVADEGAGVPVPAAREPALPADQALAGGPDARLPIAQLPESGRGLAVMRACVDNVTLDSHPGRGTVVIMRKQVRWSQDAPLRQSRAASLLRRAGLPAFPASQRAPTPPGLRSEERATREGGVLKGARRRAG